ncbi:hypothetical protein O5D80_006962 [Batrachochytrium dendrobatidis]|nr:hypothetical protein O5D80_006962 [Batrachochytrium dendrobatidis]
MYNGRALSKLNARRVELPALEDLAAIQQNVRKTEFVQSSFDREDEDSKSYVSDDEFFGGLVQHPF